MADADEAFQLRGPAELTSFSVSEDDAKAAVMDAHVEEIAERFRHLIDADDDDNDDHEEIVMGRTENNGATFLASGSACLDFFFQIVPGTPRAKVFKILKKAWKEDPLITLKLIFQLRGIRGTGKSDKLNFYNAARWLYEFHPQTLIANIGKVAPIGYFKDLLELLLRIVEGPEETTKRMTYKQGRKQIKTSREHAAKRKKDDEDSDSDSDFRRRKRHVGEKKGYFFRKGAAARAAKIAGTLKPQEERIAADIEKGKAEKARTAELRKMRILVVAKRAVDKYSADPIYRGLYDAVAKLFADHLKKDMESVAQYQEKAKLSLAAKWCPSLDCSYDRQILMCEGIACKLFPKTSFSEAITDNHQYVYRARDKLRKEVLVPLRDALKLPEVYMSANRWNELPYKNVASVAMKLYSEHFLKHDEVSFKQYLEDVASGKSKIAAGALLPHEIVIGAVKASSEEVSEVAELQWKRMVEDLRCKGTLPNSLSVVDVSGSMEGTPMDVAIALGLLTAELSDEPWKGHLVTFNNEPVLHAVQGNTLKKKYGFTKRMPWGMNTDFQAVFDRILEVARERGLRKEEMIGRLFVFSDMEFDQARGANRRVENVGWETDYMMIKRKFEEAGYGKPPEIVFWNLRDSQSTPVRKDEEGVALVSGFSKNMLKMFMEKGGAAIDPMAIMMQALSHPIYDDVLVVD